MTTDPVNPRTPAKSLGMLAMGAICLVYLLNPGWGWVELIPDNIPGVGNIDEALATVLLLRALAYFGINLAGGGKPKGRKSDPVVIDVD